MAVKANKPNKNIKANYANKAIDADLVYAIEARIVFEVIVPSWVINH